MPVELLQGDIADGHIAIVGESRREERSFSVRLCNPVFDRERELFEKRNHDLCSVHAQFLYKGISRNGQPLESAGVFHPESQQYACKILRHQSRINFKCKRLPHMMTKRVGFA